MSDKLLLQLNTISIPKTLLPVSLIWLLVCKLAPVYIGQEETEEKGRPLYTGSFKK